MLLSSHSEAAFLSPTVPGFSQRLFKAPIQIASSIDPISSDKPCPLPKLQPATRDHIDCVRFNQLRIPASFQEPYEESPIAYVPATLCKYGFPQAVAYRPFAPHRNPNSGLFRLTCPLLVKHIDQIENENSSLLDDMTREIQNHPWLYQLMLQIQTGHAQARKLLTNQDDFDHHKTRVRDPTLLDKIMQAGIAGSVGVDVKCFHAQTADALCRGRDANPVGDAVLKFIQDELGVDVTGDHQCCDQCRGVSGWEYVASKNKLGYHKRKHQRSIKIVSAKIQESSSSSSSSS